MRNLLIALTLLFFSHNCFSQTNWIGKKAPEIIVDKWINNNESRNNIGVKSSEKIEYIILEFWFPECAPCIGQIPLLNEIVEEFNNVKVLSVTFKDENRINKFLETTQLNYQVGIDTSRQTISNYNIGLYPTTLIIDSNGVIIWQDDFHFQALNKYELIDIMNGGQLNLRKSDIELDKDKKLYSFTIKDHTLDMGKASYHESGPYLINVVNKDLEELLKLFFNINKSRILDYDSTFLTKKYDITFQASKNIPIENNCTEAIKWLLPKELKFQPQSILKDTTIFVFNVINDSLLNTHLSDRKHYGESHNWDYNSNDTIPSIWKAKGATLSNLKNYFENQFNILVEVEYNDTLRYNFNLSLLSMKENISKLKEQYGIELIEKQGNIEMWEILK